MALYNLDISITDKLFPAWPTIVATLIALIILLLILTKLVYGPVKNMVQNRQKYIQNNIDQSKQSLLDSQLKQEESQMILAEARKTAENLINEAKTAANEIKAQEILTAKEAAQKVLNLAQVEIDQKHQAFEKASKHLIVEKAMQMAEMIIKQEINPKLQKKLMEEFIDDQSQVTKVKNSK